MNSRVWKFTSENRLDLCDDIIARAYRGKLDVELEALKLYVVTGDIQGFLAKGGNTVDSLSVFYMGANFSIESASKRLAMLLEDIKQFPLKYAEVVHLDVTSTNWDYLALDRIRRQYNGSYSGFLTAEQFHENFIYHYGEKFTPTNTLELEFGGSKKQYTFENDGAWLATGLLTEVLEYIFDIAPHPIFDPSRVAKLFEYLKSAMPQIPTQAYDKCLYGHRHELANGELSSFRVRQSVVRRLVALLQGVVNKTQRQFGVSNIRAFDVNELKRFKEMLESIDFPPSYYELADFVVQYGEHYPKASID